MSSNSNLLKHYVQLLNEVKGGFHPGSNRGGDGNDMGRGNGGNGDNGNNRRQQYPSERYNVPSANRYGRRASSEFVRDDSPPRRFDTNEDNYEDFLAWKESTSRASRRARSEEDNNAGPQDNRRRRATMFNM